MVIRPETMQGRAKRGAAPHARRRRHRAAGIAGRGRRIPRGAGRPQRHDACTRPGKTMRILELHSPYFRALWRRAGHEVLAWGPHPECDFQTTAAALPLGDLLRALPAGWSPDLIVLGDDC